MTDMGILKVTILAASKSKSAKWLNVSAEVGFYSTAGLSLEKIQQHPTGAENIPTLAALLLFPDFCCLNVELAAGVRK